MFHDDRMHGRRALVCSLPAATLVAVVALSGCATGPDGDGDTAKATTPEATPEAPPGRRIANMHSINRSDAAPVIDVVVPDAPPPGMQFVLDGDGLPTSVADERNTSMWKCDPLLRDLDGDGDLDLAAIPRLEPDGPRAWRNEVGEDGRRRWVDWSDGLRWDSTSCGGGLEAADVDGDGRTDLIVACHCEGVFVYRNLGEDGWEAIAREINPPVPDTVDDPYERDLYIGAEDCAVGDLNGDGHLDLGWVSSDEGGMAIFFGDGSGRRWTVSRPGILPRRGWGLRIDFVDVDLDEDLDVVSTYADGPRVWLNDGTGGLTLAASGLPSPRVRGIYFGQRITDMNGDGLPDLVFANWVDGPEVYLQERSADGTPRWAKQPDVFPQMFGGAVGVAVADMNGDDRPDIVVAGRLRPDTGAWSRGAFVLLARESGRYEWEPRYDLPWVGMTTPGGIAVGDINGDGVADVAVGTGLIVETDEHFPQPPVDPRLAVYTSRPRPAEG